MLEVGKNVAEFSGGLEKEKEEEEQQHQLRTRRGLSGIVVISEFHRHP